MKCRQCLRRHPEKRRFCTPKCYVEYPDGRERRAPRGEFRLLANLYGPPRRPSL